jgi:DNA-binding CsgD family transcriptional regulator
MIGGVSIAAVSRTVELQAVDILLMTATARPSGLVIAGESGIGKTTLWNEAVEHARRAGYRVLSARAGEAESVLTYAAVADLLADVEDEVLDQLSDLQRIAVDRVLLRASADGPPTDQRVTAAALVSVVTALTVHAPVLIAVDDAQWLDSSSLPVLETAARQLTGRVGLVITERTTSDTAEPAPWLKLNDPATIKRLRVGPMTAGALHTIICARLGRPLPRTTLVRIAEASAGNPFYALELARALNGQSVSDDAVLPSTLADLMQLRTGHFSDAVADMLLAAGCVAEATVELLAQATGVPVGRVVELLDGPEREGIVVIEDNRVRFSHPLLARGIYTQAGPARRRRMHRSLANVESQPELRARHMALGAASADPETLHALDAAADAASVRGAAAAAAELTELAIGLGGDTPARRLHAAKHRFQANETHRVRDLLEPVIDTLPPGLDRASATILLGGTWVYANDFVPAKELLTAALTDAADSPLLMVRAHLGLAVAEAMTGEHSTAYRHAALAVEQAERLGMPAVLSQALALQVTLACGRGMGRDESALRQALESEDPDADVPAAVRARTAAAITSAWMGRLDEARTTMLVVRRRCIERGSDSDMMHLSWHLSMINIWMARYGAAEVVADDMMQRADHIGGDFSLAQARVQRALVSAYQGREQHARNEIRDALAGAQRCGTPKLAVWAIMALGFLEVSRGNYADALVALAPLLAAFDGRGGTEIITGSYIPDAVEAMVALGRLDDAEPFIAALERNGAELDRPWMLAVGGRCRAMVLAARGDLVAAETMADQALAEHDRLPMPFERARTQLFIGQLARRQRRKQVAAQTLSDVVTEFRQLGTRLWVDRARAELARVNVARTRDSDLTPSETSVAKHAAAGMTNRDIAAALFISPKTVEHNLSRIYRKLGVRTRAELARHSDLIEG